METKVKIEDVEPKVKMEVEAPSESSSDHTIPSLEDPSSAASSQASTVSIDVVVFPGKFVNHSRAEPLDVHESNPSSPHIVNNTNSHETNGPEVAMSSGGLNGIDPKRKRTLDKEIMIRRTAEFLSSKPRVIAGLGSDEEIIVENGNGEVPIITTSECVDEQIPAFLFTTKSWKHLTA